MTTQPQMFRINPETRESQPVEEVEFARLGFQERRDIQEWVAANPSILGHDLLIIGKEFSGFDLTNERLDLLAVDPDGQLVIIELKRDDSGADAHWQAIKYASYFRKASAEQLVGILAEYEKISEGDAIQKLLEHLGADDLNSLNYGQRITLASHRFAPEVTSAALWLNDQADKDIITCIQLIPYHDPETGALYVQASTVIPLPTADPYEIGIGGSSEERGSSSKSSFATKLRASFAESRSHPATPFLRKAAEIAIHSLPEEIRPNRQSQRANGSPNAGNRYYNLWYRTPPWSNHGVSYRFDLFLASETNSDESKWNATVRFVHRRHPQLGEILKEMTIHPGQIIRNQEIAVELGSGSLDDDQFRNLLAETMRKFIETITPIVQEYLEEANAEDA